MRLILLGPPGSGKGTQAALLSQRLGLAHISTGDILRDAVARGTPEGLRARPFLEGGKLVPDDLVNEIIAARFRRDDRPEGFLMDGYPRTLAQAASFKQMLGQQFLGIDAVIYLAADDEEIVRRLSGRWTCPNCKATYHAVSKPPRVAGVCDVCQSKLMQRDDDRPETIRQRLHVYHDQTEDLIAHYRSAGLLHEVKGAGDIEKIYANIVGVLKGVQPRV
jgi:adenylate kinase